MALPKLHEKLLFLTSPRFWSMVIAAVTLYLQQKDYIGDAEAVLIGTISAGFWVTQTVDRASEKLGKTETEAEAERKKEEETGNPPADV